MDYLAMPRVVHKTRFMIQTIGMTGTLLVLQLGLLLIYISDNSLTHRFETRPMQHAIALVAEACPQHGVAAATQMRLTNKTQRCPDLTAGVVVVELHAKGV